jgi:hypothetical protein
MTGQHLPYRALRSKGLSWLTHARQAQIPISRYERSVEEPRSRRSHAGRVPTFKQLAALMVDGILTLPPYYRRGMYLDLLV